MSTSVAECRGRDQCLALSSQSPGHTQTGLHSRGALQTQPHSALSRLSCCPTH